MSSIEDLKKRYCGTNAVIADNIDDSTQILSALENAVGYDCPDGYYVGKDTIYVFEHFEFDSYPHNKKGSKLQQEFANSNRKLSTTDLVSYRYNVESNFANYKANFISSFLKHHKMIETYKDNIIKETKICNYQFKMVFVVEDSTPFGNYVTLDGKHIGFIAPFYVPEIKEVLNENKGVDCFIFAFGNSSQKKMVCGSFSDERQYEEPFEFVPSASHFADIGCTFLIKKSDLFKKND